MDENKKTLVRAEVIAIGDELTSGQRLDTNSQWISQKLNELGITVAFHSTVGDSHADNLNAFRSAVSRVDLVICTGGLGPTADDLTRHVLAEVSGAALTLHEPSLKHIKSLFERRGRTMPESNRIQAYLPENASVIGNPHGSAPGIEIETNVDSNSCLVFALPGVPAELKEMWNSTVHPKIKSVFDLNEQIFHHTIHCFGKGESEIESLIPELIARDREPLVGITASRATISLRIQARAKTQIEFLEKIQPTLNQIQDQLGELVFGESDIELQDVVTNQLVERKQTLAIIDVGHHGMIGGWLSKAQNSSKVFRGSSTMSGTRLIAGRKFNLDGEESLEELAAFAASTFNADIGIAYHVTFPHDSIGPGDFQIQLVCTHKSDSHHSELVGSSHPSIREARIGKWVLNQIRLWLRSK